ncbi:MAG TPA: DUF2007 domain-containing protein [Alphaproteobacteria bacterium]
MKELLRTNDPVFLSWAQSVLAESGIHAVVLDSHTAAVEGSISAIARRVMVVDGDYEAAVQVLEAARAGATRA